jgi:hypothetical protein
VSNNSVGLSISPPNLGSQGIAALTRRSQAKTMIAAAYLQALAQWPDAFSPTFNGMPASRESRLEKTHPLLSRSHSMVDADLDAREPMIVRM